MRTCFVLCDAGQITFLKDGRPRPTCHLNRFNALVSVLTHTHSY